MEFDVVFVYDRKTKQYTFRPFKDESEKVQAYFKKHLGKSGRATFANVSIDVGDFRAIKRITTSGTEYESK